MLPQVDSQVLSSNAQFALLVKDLHSAKLNQDGTSKIVDKTGLKERQASQEELRKARVALARKQILKDALRQIAQRKGGLPDELQDMIHVVLARLEGKLAPEDHDIAIAETDNFLENMDTMASDLSTHIHQNALLLSRIIADPSSASNNGRTRDLAPGLSELKSSIAQARTQLDAARIALADQSTALLETNRTLLQTIIRRLEQTLHGSVARGSRARADHLARVAEAMEKKIRLTEAQVLQQTYSPEVREALGAREEELRREAGAVRRKVRQAREEVDGYEAVRGMRQIADAYAEILREREKVRGDVERLEAR